MIQFGTIVLFFARVLGVCFVTLGGLLLVVCVGLEVVERVRGRWL